MKRVPEVIDCWFDSGAMPFAQHHYPFENKELFEAQFPADFISEAVDQTRGWFYSLLAISTLIFNKAPFKNVIVLGHVQDENGQKMSKSKGNAVDPFDALETYGADAIRWYFYTNSAPWLPNRFHGKAVVEGQRKFMSTLWNTYAFFVLYANIDSFDPTKYKLEFEKLSLMDKWILSRLATAVKGVDENLENYRIPEACRYLQDFVDELSNWYVRRGRERYWGKDMPQDKVNAYMTLYTALKICAEAAAPMIPFLSEEIYQNLVRSVSPSAPESVHLCDYPACPEEWINKALEEDMDELLKIVVAGRAARAGSAIKNRQPLSEMIVKCDHALSEDLQAIIADELNVKKITFSGDVDGYLSYSFKPQLKTCGPKFGKVLGELKAALASLDGSEAKKELDADSSLALDLPSGRVVLAPEDLIVSTEQKEGYFAVADGAVTVVLNTALTPDLIEEGFVREIVSKIQQMRKEAGFEVTDHIEIAHAGSAAIEKIFASHAAEISADTLCDRVTTELSDTAREWDVNGEKVTLSVKKL